MKTVNIPQGYQQVMPYLIVPNASQFFEFLQQVFDAKQKLVEMRNETTILHAEAVIGDSTLMYTDSTEEHSPCPAGMFIWVDNCDAVYQQALDAGATSIMEPATMNYGRASGVRDNFGNRWWITAPLIAENS